MEVLGQLATWFLVFVFYSMIGWVVIEMGYDILVHHKISNRGFLIGPVCPIYGVGALLITVLFGRMDNLLEIFVLSMLTSGLLEYFTSVVMEWMFHVRWWDYSEKPFNLQGRVCLEVLCYFGIAGILVVKVLNPLMFDFFESWDVTVRVAVAGVVLLIGMLDLLFSLWLLICCRVAEGTRAADATEEIAQNVRDLLVEKGKTAPCKIKKSGKRTKNKV